MSKSSQVGFLVFCVINGGIYILESDEEVERDESELDDKEECIEFHSRIYKVPEMTVNIADQDCANSSEIFSLGQDFLASGPQEKCVLALGNI